MAVIDPDGLFGGDRLRRCSNAAQLHWSRLFLASDGFARLEINYARIVGRTYPTFHPAPSETELQSWIQEYAKNYLLFLYAVDGQVWGQWDTRKELLPRYKKAADRRSPIPPEPAFTEWKKQYRSEITAFPKSFGKISETFLHGVGVGVGVGKNNCASDDARVAAVLPLDVVHLGASRTDSVSSQPPRAASSTQALASQQEVWFAAWWAEYWHKRAKKTAWGAFRKHVKTEERFQVVMAATRAQTPEMLQREPSKRPYAATWLNGERWEDEIETKPHTPVNGPGQPSQYTYSPPTNLLTDDQIAAERARKRAQMETRSA